MRPASTAERWSERSAALDVEKAQAVERIGLIKAANEREEALAVAVLLRRQADVPGRVAALVTPDRGLARRVAVELKRWGIEVDDSAGRPLGRTPAGTLARLVAETALNGAAAETLLALLKHPLTALGASAFETRRAARNLERAVLRGPRLKPGLAALRHALDLRFAEHWAEPRRERRRTQAARSMSERMWDDAKKLAERVEQALQHFEQLASSRGTVALTEIVEAHIAALAAVAADQNRRTMLFSDEAGEALSLLFEELRASASSGPAIAPRDYPGLFTALIERAMVRRRGGVDPRIHIWGALEARLQSVDVVVLGGLNEGTWPAQTRLDPLLSRPMRAALSLEPPERRIGLAAHDFAQALGQPEVWLTRADRQDGEPKVASRWLQRLTAYAGEDPDRDDDAARRRNFGLGANPRPRCRDRSSEASKTLAADREAPETAFGDADRDADPRSLRRSMRDPFCGCGRSSRSAKHPTPPSAACWSTACSKSSSASGRPVPIDIARRAAAPRDRSRGVRKTIAIFPKSWRSGGRVLRKSRAGSCARRRRGATWLQRNVESIGEMQVTPDFLLTSRADRLDALADGGLAIIDYKTGAPPSPKEVRIALAAASAGRPDRAAGRLRRRRRGRAGAHRLLPPDRPRRWWRSTTDRSELKRRAAKRVTLAETLATTEQRLHRPHRTLRQAGRRLSIQQNPKAAPHLCRRLRPSRAHRRMGRDRSGR